MGARNRLNAPCPGCTNFPPGEPPLILKTLWERAHSASEEVYDQFVRDHVDLDGTVCSDKNIEMLDALMETAWANFLAELIPHMEKYHPTAMAMFKESQNATPDNKSS